LRTAIITGASAGLGKEYVLAAARKYRDIDEFWLIARRADLLEEIKSVFPEDISVIGCDDMGIASYYKIALSSINLNIEEACKTAVETLFYKILNPSYCIIKSVSVHSKFIDRKTVEQKNK
jgi:DNA-binding LacI/PurR family transcriptional regulator